ncbi:PLP-dependent transferase [Tilletiaria anomala UBC 951]|uniref:PLP-dependent transferase n=1 Tax=Tilletiaria anomala (strain ATCC 24038 / CBS 436.72 / UBC 951) TaxID=1037660 RepID=A0A066VKF0_TILAU|nr:PLP-dependent transferase [Tilletiaria anomala UBC 951]KDN39234.1 PLP-dependent transferase [Tilletiaria anomala UBC 951]
MPPTLSTRGAVHAATVTPFWSIFEDLLQNPYNPVTRKGRFVNMGIANNSLMSDDLLRYFNSHLQLVPEDLTYGSSLFGSTRLFAAICKLYNSDYWSPHEPVRPEHIITAPGCGSLLDQLAEHLADAGDAFLAAAPYYNGFDADLATRANVRCLPVYSDMGDGAERGSFEGPTALRGFQSALDAAARNGTRVRAVLLNQPCNPVGRCYDREAMLEYGRFCEKNNLFLVVDEIYALSVFPTSDNSAPAPFISALSIDWKNDAGVDPARIVIVSSASKDFTSNGLRVGTLVCQHNDSLIRAMKATAKLAMVSSAADALWSALLHDDAFLPWFIETNRQRLSDAYETCKAWCMRMGIAYTPSNAGHFMLVDLAPFLPTTLDGTKLNCEESETALWAKFLDHGVALTPGFNYHHPKTGTFRITFSLERPALEEGLARLERALRAVGEAGGDAAAATSACAEGAHSGARLGTGAILCGIISACTGSRAPAADHDSAIHEGLARLQIAAACSACCC